MLSLLQAAFHKARSPMQIASEHPANLLSLVTPRIVWFPRITLEPCVNWKRERRDFLVQRERMDVCAGQRCLRPCPKLGDMFNGVNLSGQNPYVASVSRLIHVELHIPKDDLA